MWLVAQLTVELFFTGVWIKWPFKVVWYLLSAGLCLYPIPEQTSFTNHRSWDKSQIHPTCPSGPPAFWQTPGPDWEICAQFRGQVWCDPRMIYMASGGVHMIWATLAKFSFGVSDSFEGKCIRWRQMGSPTGTKRVSSKSWGTQKTTQIPPFPFKALYTHTHNSGGVREKKLNIQVLSRIWQK